MAKGYVYVWESSESEFTGGRLTTATVSLMGLTSPLPAAAGLSGRYVEVVNAGRVAEPGDDSSDPVSVPIGNARPNSKGNYIFDPAAGGGQLKVRGTPLPLHPDHYIETSHFGEVNAYYHLTKIAEYVDKLLERLGEKPLPRVRALVNAYVESTRLIHHRDGVRDGRGVRWLPVRGAHYLMREKAFQEDREHVSYSGEIVLGPGLGSTREGWLPRVSGTSYARNESHNATQIYRQYGHHITHHTADFAANWLRLPSRRNNLKTATESAISDYWAAAMLGTPHIRCWHRRHDSQFIDRRSLAGSLTMADFDVGPNTQAHHNGTILASALWDLRQALEIRGDGICDLLILAALLEVRRLLSDPYRPKVDETRRLRDGFPVFAACLVHADKSGFGGKYSTSITNTLKRRGITFCRETLGRLAQASVPALVASLTKTGSGRKHVEKICSLFPEAIIPSDDDLLHPDDLALRLRGIRDTQYDLAAVGDVMTGGRMRHAIRKYGPDYVLAWVKPLFQRATVIFGNLEGPFAEEADQDTMKKYSYKVNPKSAPVLRRGGFCAMTIANNHLLDCGRDGVRETLATLERQGIRAFGGGADESTAHNPAILNTRSGRVGLLGYYWNRRTAARGDLPGSARDIPELVERDIKMLKPQVDRVVVTVHWGVTYERHPSAEDRIKARHFIDCGADVVIGHHPHIIQPVEVYRQRPIFYSVGNFAFGSGNSRAESLVVCLRFLSKHLEADIFPVYVQNRDPRVDYQPKVMCGTAASQTLERLASISGEDGKALQMRDFYARLRVDF